MEISISNIKYLFTFFGSGNSTILELVSDHLGFIGTVIIET